MLGGDVGPIEIGGDAGKMEGIILTSSTTMWSPFPSGEGLIMLRMIKNQSDKVRCSAGSLERSFAREAQDDNVPCSASPLTPLASGCFATPTRSSLVRVSVRSFAREAQDDKNSG